MPPTRSRQSGASTVANTPRSANTAVSRVAGTPRSTNTASSRRSGQATIPDYQAPLHPLNENAQRAINNLLTSHSTKGLDRHLKNAASILAENAGSVNETFSVADEELKKLKTKRAKQDHVDDDEKERILELEANLEETRAKVEKMSRQMDECVRKIIDSNHHLSSVKDTIGEIAKDARVPGATQPSQQTRSQRNRNHDNSDDEEEDQDEEYHDFTPTDPAGGPTQATQPGALAPSAAFKDKLDLKKDQYQTFSLKQRYARDPDYVTFKRMLHDGQHPNGDGGDLPHADTWFNTSSVPAPGVTTRAGASANDSDSDDDLAIAKETISTKCPLTLQEYREPVTSRKCPHSFEKEAIESMILDPTNTVRVGGVPQPSGRRAIGGEKAVQCPVPGCQSMLTLADLGVDVVLKRKIWRLQRAARMEEEEDGGGRGEVQDIGSSDNEGMDIDRLDGGGGGPSSARRIKGERMSTAPRRTPAPRSSAMQVVDMDEDEDEDE